MREVIDLAPALTRGLATEPLLEDAGARVAARFGAEAATLTHGFAGAVLLAALAVRPAGRAVVHLAAHDIEIAGPLRDVLAVAGAMPRPVGSVDSATSDDLEAALGPEVAAACWIADQRLEAARLIGLPAFRYAAHRHRIPTIVLQPAGETCEALLDAGADLVVLDAATALAGPPLGIVAGRAHLVASARTAQAAGPGRLTLPGPEALAALVAGEPEDRAGRLEERRNRLADRLAGRPGLGLEPVPGGLVLRLDPRLCGTTARDLAHALASGRPALLTDDRDAHAGRLGLDLARLDEAVFATVLDILATTLAQPIAPAPWP